jgi:phage baseplate assembly protein W
MTNEFLGVGWKYPPTVDETGQIATAEYEESVRQAIWTILSTAPGERVMRPDFGCGIHDLLFAPNSPGTAGQLMGEVRRALVRWEPRIDILEVDAAPDPDRPNRLLVVISYQVRATSNQFNLVYPFYLE